jgi:serine phosphatase RsbU (regulator of sigma subunit)
MFGTDRMIDALNMHAGLNSKEILSGMKNAVDVFVGDAEPFDDLTMLCLEYFG